MKQMKQALAVILVVILACSSLAVCASAFQVNSGKDQSFASVPTTAADYNYGITTKFFRKVEGNWVPTDGIVKRGEKVKARVYIETNYDAGAMDLSFAYNEDFFTFNYDVGVTLNSVSEQPAVAHFDVPQTFDKATSAALYNRLKNWGVISAGDIAGYAFATVTVPYKNEQNPTAVNFGDIDFSKEGTWENKWFCEAELTVKSDADSKMAGVTGDFLVLPCVVQSTSSQDGYINIPLVPAGSSVSDAQKAYTWLQQTPYLASDPQKVVNDVTFFGTKGKFTGNKTQVKVTAFVGEQVNVETPVSTSGDSFSGWKEADASGAVVGDELLQNVNADYVAKYYAAVWNAAEAGVILNANKGYFADESQSITITKSGDDNTVTYPAEITSGEGPTREGYELLGWSTDKDAKQGGQLPTAFSASTATYYAVWQAVNYNLTYHIPTDVEKNQYTVYETPVSVPCDETIVYKQAPATVPAGYRFLQWAVYNTESGCYEDAPATMPAKDLDVYAICEAEINNVTYYIDGEFLASFVLDTGANIPVSSKGLFGEYEGPTYGSDYFDGWYTDEECLQKLADGAKVPSGGIELYAKTSVAARFYGMKGEIPQVTYCKFMDPITGPAKEPTREGYTFEGWDEFGLADNKNGKDFYAAWEVIEYPATFVVESEEPETFDLEYGSLIAKQTPPDPYVKGKVFLYWRDANGFIVNESTTMPANAVTYYAVFENAPEYTVTWYVDDALVKTEDYEEEDAIESYTWQGDGYEDIGVWTWSYVNDGGDEVTLKNTPNTMPAHNLVAKAQKTAKNYDLTVKIAGESAKKVSYAFGADIQPVEADKREGYVFDGWYADENYKTPYEFGKMPVGGVIIYGRYNKNDYTITYYVDDKPYETAVSLPYGETVTQKDAPADQTGYTFSGWQWYDAKGEKISKPTVMPAENLKVKGSFEVIKSTVTYIVEGETTKFENVAYGTKVPTVPNPKKDGYTFNGWSPAFNATMGDRDVEYTATWLVNSHKVTYALDGGNSTEQLEYNNVAFGTAFPTIANPTREGFSFVCWDSKVPATMPDEDVTLTAVWFTKSAQQAVYTVTLFEMDTTGNYPQTGSVVKSGMGDVGTTVQLSDFNGIIPTGFTLDAEKANVTSGVLANGSVVELVAYCKRDVFTITWKGNEGTVNGKAQDDVFVYYGANVVAPTTAREGYSLTGWDKPIVSPAVASAEYTAQWAINQYEVRYVLNGGTVNGSANDIVFADVSYGGNIPAPSADPAKEGYTFEGWDLDGNGTKDTMYTEMPDRKVTASAVYSVNSYNATFDANTGKFPEGATTTVLTEYNQDIVAVSIPEPTKEGHRFLGWSRNDSATKADSSLGKMNSTDGVKFYAVWSVNQYTVTYLANGGAFGDSTDKDVVTYTYGATILKHEEPKKENNSFNTWEWFDENSSPIAEPTVMPAYNVTAQAKYKEARKALFYKDYAVNSTEIVCKRTGDVGDTILPPDENPTKEGYEFLGWYEINSANQISDVKVTNFGKFTEADRRFTAKWSKNQATVTFNANGGKWDNTDTIRSTQANVGDDIVAYNPAPSNEGFAFLGWSVNPGASDKDSSLGKVSAGGNTLYAVWKAAQYKVTFDANGGAYADSSTEYNNYVNYNDTINPPANAPTREGHQFLGWSESKTADTALNSLGKMPNGSKTFYAVWKAHEYTISYYSVNPNNAYKVQTYKYGETVVLPENPSAEGHSFTGWNWYRTDTTQIAKPATMPAENLIAKAQWDLKSYTVTYNLNGGNIGGDTSDKVFLNRQYGSDTPTVSNPVKAGAEFKGWSPKVTDKVTDNVTYYAQWNSKNIYTVTYNLDGGTVDGNFGPIEKQVTEGDPTPTVNTPVKDGFVFAGWSPEISSTVKDNVTYTAQWRTLSGDDYIVTYIVDGKNYQTYVLKAGQTIPEPAKPVKDGYEFLGWTWKDSNGKGMTAKPGTMPAENLTATAVFNVVPEKDDKEKTDITVIDFDIDDIIDPAVVGGLVDGLFDLIGSIDFELPDITLPEGKTDGDKDSDDKKDEKNTGGTDIPNTGSATGIVVFAVIATATGAAYVYTKKKNDSDDSED